MEIIECEQGSDQWFQVRRGKITASRFKDVISKGRGSAASKTRLTYMYELAAEILTGESQDGYTNPYMEWGTEIEPLACQVYEKVENVEVKHVGFIKHSEWIGVSPDGLLDSNGLLEVKCPKTTTQLKWYLNGNLPPEHKAQVMGQLLYSEREFCDFLSYDPRLDAKCSYFKVRVNRDEDYIKDLEIKINDFVYELQELLFRLRV